jgi:DNA-binding response OmpR family regulator
LQAENTPRLDILDWMMPGMNSIEVYRKIRNAGKDLYTCIILLTTLIQDEDLVTGMNAGADGLIIQPFKANELKVRLRAGRRIIYFSRTS